MFRRKVQFVWMMEHGGRTGSGLWPGRLSLASFDRIGTRWCHCLRDDQDEIVGVVYVTIGVICRGPPFFGFPTWSLDARATTVGLD